MAGCVGYRGAPGSGQGVQESRDGLAPRAGLVMYNTIHQHGFGGHMVCGRFTKAGEHGIYMMARRGRVGLGVSTEAHQTRVSLPRVLGL
jgi:hypothetical protein